MMFVKNWHKMYKSLAVILPTVVVFLLAIIEASLQTDLVPKEYIPLVILITGFIGRIIPQKTLNDSEGPDYE